MALLNENIQNQVRQVFESIQNPVRLLMFTQGEGGALECQMCHDTRQLIEEVASLSDKVSVEVYDFVGDSKIAEQHGVDKIPAVVIAGEKDYGVRFYGIPSGYEFSSLIEGIVAVGRREPSLSKNTLQEVQKLNKPVHIQVFVTPTCPYCPQAVVLAHNLALASDWIKADMVEASEFPHLANKYQVYGVPRTVINEVIHLEGAYPEEMLLPELMQVLDDQAMSRLEADWQK
jgi:glutaredoxin-like protein